MHKLSFLYLPMYNFCMLSLMSVRYTASLRKAWSLANSLEKELRDKVLCPCNLGTLQEIPQVVFEHFIVNFTTVYNLNAFNTVKQHKQSAQEKGGQGSTAPVFFLYAASQCWTFTN